MKQRSRIFAISYLTVLCGAIGMAALPSVGNTTSLLSSSYQGQILVPNYTSNIFLRPNNMSTLTTTGSSTNFGPEICVVEFVAKKGRPGAQKRQRQQTPAPQTPRVAGECSPAGKVLSWKPVADSQCEPKPKPGDSYRCIEEIKCIKENGKLIRKPFYIWKVDPKKTTHHISASFGTGSNSSLIYDDFEQVLTGYVLYELEEEYVSSSYNSSYVSAAWDASDMTVYSQEVPCSALGTSNNFGSGGTSPTSIY